MNRIIASGKAENRVEGGGRDAEFADRGLNTHPTHIEWVVGLDWIRQLHGIINLPLGNNIRMIIY